MTGSLGSPNWAAGPQLDTRTSAGPRAEGRLARWIDANPAQTVLDVGLRLLQGGIRCTRKDSAKKCPSGPKVQSLEDIGGEHVFHAEATVTVLASVSLPRELVEETSDSADHFATLAQTGSMAAHLGA